MEISGKIQAIKFDVDMKRWSVLIGDTWISAFEKEDTDPALKALMRELKKGDHVSIDATESVSKKTGKTYLNIKGIERVIQGADITSPPPPSGITAPPSAPVDHGTTAKGKAVQSGGYDATDLRISRGGACHDAATVVAAEIREGRKFSDGKELEDYFLTLADRIAYYIIKGE